MDALGGSGNITCTAPALIVSEEEIQEGIGSYGFGAALANTYAHYSQLLFMEE